MSAVPGAVDFNAQRKPPAKPLLAGCHLFGCMWIARLHLRETQKYRYNSVKWGVRHVPLLICVTGLKFVIFSHTYRSYQVFLFANVKHDLTMTKPLKV